MSKHDPIKPSEPDAAWSSTAANGKPTPEPEIGAQRFVFIKNPCTSEAASPVAIDELKLSSRWAGEGIPRQRSVKQLFTGLNYAMRLPRG